jgi:opacity protein-like surface antigen
MFVNDEPFGRGLKNVPFAACDTRMRIIRYGHGNTPVPNDIAEAKTRFPAWHRSCDTSVFGVRRRVRIEHLRTSRSKASRAVALKDSAILTQYHQNAVSDDRASMPGVKKEKGHSMRSKILAIVTVLALATSPAFAGGGEKGDWELGLYGGYGWLDDYGLFTPDNDMILGARLGYFLSNHWNLELSGQRLKTDTEFDPVLALTDTEMRLDALRLNLLYNFGGPGGFRPFLTGGLGREWTDIEDYFDTGDFGWNLGAGFRAFLSPRWNLRVDGRYVNTKVGEDVDESQQNFEATLGLGFLFGGGGGQAEEPISIQQPNQPPTVSCAAERSEILPGESVNLSATASDPEGDPLTYAWSATSGRVNGTGSTATFDFTGVTAPSTATVTVRATDSKGNTGSSDCAVRLVEPVRPAAVSCVAGGFPRNLSRLSNVDKACLDDVTQRLNSDPRARVIVIGHTDSRETSAISQKRAEAVRDYLVKERSIEASRITIRSAAATKPLATGTDAAALAENRRVEVWFVPEGATVPE